ncbi:nucleoside diphosphate kinase 7 [Octopus sinensis]|uniref:Nucleoside diphosphate kinase 7 n=1 Tax=Octopus sinensis TaxID=2607531 RepID=A0A6P7S7L7_9MOLL|nr:nucleoside diphosphate kinase 7 [Octopus sinensis]
MLGGNLENQNSEEDCKRYCFVVDWYDAVASLTRRYQFLYYPKDKSVEMYEYKKHRVFLRRTVCDNISLEDLYIGSVINLFSRQLNVVDFGDEFTRRELTNQTQKTLGLLNAKAVPKMGEMFEFIQNKGFKITKMKMCVLTRAEAAEFCLGYKDKEFYMKLIENMTSGPVVALELLGDDAICSWLRALGPVNTEEAVASAPLTISAHFGEANLCYGPRCAGEAAQQLEFFFPTSGGIIRRNPVVLEDCTCCVVKPHAVLSGLAPKIIRTITDAGFEITAIQMFHLERLCAEEFLEVYKGVVPEYPSMVTELTSGPCVAIALRAKDAPKAFREMAGPADPEIARHLRPRSLRAQFGIDKIKNAVHCTDLPEDGILEVEYFFKILDR